MSNSSHGSTKYRTSLLEGLKDIQNWNQENLHILVASRRETEIEDVLCILATDTITLEESVVDGDFYTYIRYQLQHDVKLSKWSKNIREEIEIALVNGANGMFRWVECQLDAIRGCLKLSLLRKALRTLLKTLDETYARIPNNIPGEHVEDARRILCCLICAFDTLTIEEVAETVATVVDGQPYYDIESRFQEPRDILTICSRLVSTTELLRRNELDREESKTQGLRFCHFSVKEYLTSGRIASAHASRFALGERYAHELLANLCINNLLCRGQEDVFQIPRVLLDCDQISDRSAFALYAASFWSDHLQAAQCDRSKSLYSECIKIVTLPALLGDVMRLRRTWFTNVRKSDDTIDVCRKAHTGGLQPGFFLRGGDIEVVSPLYYISLLGLDNLVLRLLAAGEDINSAGSQGTCLAAAAFAGHKTTVRLLLDKSAGINAVFRQTDGGQKSDYLPSALQWAAQRGHEDIVEMLLAEGVDVNICRLE